MTKFNFDSTQTSEEIRKKPCHFILKTLNLHFCPGFSLDKEAIVTFKIDDFTKWTTTSKYNTHIAQHIGKEIKECIWLVDDVRNIFL